MRRPFGSPIRRMPPTAYSPLLLARGPLSAGHRSSTRPVRSSAKWLRPMSSTIQAFAAPGEGQRSGHVRTHGGARWWRTPSRRLRHRRGPLALAHNGNLVNAANPGRPRAKARGHEPPTRSHPPPRCPLPVATLSGPCRRCRVRGAYSIVICPAKYLRGPGPAGIRPLSPGIRKLARGRRLRDFPFN